MKRSSLLLVSAASPASPHVTPGRFLIQVLCALALAAAARAQLVRQANTTLTLPADLPAATGYTTQNALGTLTFSSPIDVASLRGVTNRLFVLQRNLGIQIVNLDTLTKSTFMSLSTYLTAQGRPLRTDGDAGILGFAFHPNYNQNGFFYVYYSLAISGQLHQRLSRFTATGAAGNYNAATAADPATESVLITQRDPAVNHNGGAVRFGPDGYLYVSVGDGGGERDGSDNGRRIAKDFMAAIMRLDVDQKPGSLAPNPHDESTTATAGDSAITPGSYRIPPDNPFVTMAQGTGTATYNGYTFQTTAIRTEFYATGVRSPWRMEFDPLTGRLFLGDVGELGREEIDIVFSGFNGGWSWREGSSAHTPAVAPLTPPLDWTSNGPIYDYDRTSNGTPNDSVIYGVTVIGGLVYRGDRLPELFGKYIFADNQTGFIAAITEGPNGAWGGGANGYGQRLATDNGIVAFAYDPRNDDAIFCDIVQGQVKRLARTGTSGAAPPATLSASGAFSNPATLTPNEGLVAYTPNVNFWSDYAIKSRWFAIRNMTDTVGFSAGGNWTLPAGMVWIKHFDFDATRGDPGTRRKLETRILVKTATDVYGLSYKWRADQSDADLVPEDGLTELVAGSIPAQTWRYPSRTDCRMCHTSQGGFALSFNTRQMNRAHSYGAETPNQIAALGAAGYFTAPAPSPNLLPAYAPAGDTTASLEWRVRSYLAVNCVQCHQPGGIVSSAWDARSTTPTDLANLINGPLINDGGDPLNRWCVPADIPHSMILKRLAGSGVPRMPPLGTSERDLAAEQLLTDWINSLDSRQSFAQWQTVNFPGGGTNGQPAADPDGDGQTNEVEYLAGTSPLDAADMWTWDSIATSAGGITLAFDQPAGTSVQVESSTDAVTWSLWEVPGNAPSFLSTGGPRFLTAPATGARRFFRPHFTQP